MYIQPSSIPDLTIYVGPVPCWPVYWINDPDHSAIPTYDKLPYYCLKCCT